MLKIFKRSEETVENLANKLILKLKEEGNSIASPTVADDFGSLTIFAHDIGTEKPYLSIQAHDWEIKTKAHFKEF